MKVGLTRLRIVTADHGDADRTLIYTGRPLRVRQTDYVKSWANRQDEIKKLTSEGKIPHDVELEKHPEKSMEGKMWLMGDVSALINDVKPAKEIVDDMIAEAKGCLERGSKVVAANGGGARAKL